MTRTSATVVADSVSVLTGQRLTTIEVTLHRFVLAELNTHRHFCLSGDTLVWFRQPNGVTRKEPLGALYDKWMNGAAERPSKRGRDWPVHLLVADKTYSMPEVASLLGMSSMSNLNGYCRDGRIAAEKVGRAWHATGSAVAAGLQSHPNRQPLRDQIRRMALDQVDEGSLDLGLTTVTDVIFSGEKDVYRVSVGRHSIKASADHLFLTPDGWRRVADFSAGQKVAAVSYGKPEDEHHGDRFKKVGGRWVNQWVRGIKHLLPETCDCGAIAVDAHHKVPVHVDPTLAFELSNIAHLCVACHKEAHCRQGWQEGVRRYVEYAEVDSVEYVGREKTYDISVAGEFPNFIADGFVVHNSRNSASSRAIPVEKQLTKVVTNPAWPLEWPCEQSGMQGGELLQGDDLFEACQLFTDAHDAVTGLVQNYLTAHPDKATRLHKSLVNRLLEPWMWHTVIISSTDFTNFFEQRCSPLAQPEIRAAAEMMASVYEASTPVTLQRGEWHTPYIQPDEYEELDLPFRCMVSAARCARVSYLTHDGDRDVDKDIQLYDRLMSAQPKHWSPTEHVATPAKPARWWRKEPLGNFDGWHQLRHHGLPA
jgi:hypothetical protein